MTSLNVWGEMLRKWNVFYFPECLNVTSTAFTETACIAKLTSKCQKFRYFRNFNNKLRNRRPNYGQIRYQRFKIGRKWFMFPVTRLT